MERYILNAERKRMPTKNTLSSKEMNFFKKWRKNTFPDKQKLREFITTRLALQEMLKWVLQAKIKGQKHEYTQYTDKDKYIVKFRKL